MLTEFRDFLMRGNLIELAVAFVIGAAFGNVITSLVENMFTPLISVLPGIGSFAALDFTIGDGVFRYGLFLNALIAFVVTAAAIFFFVVKPVGELMARRETEAPPEEQTRDCPECKSEIPALATRCAHCTTQIAPTA